MSRAESPYPIFTGLDNRLLDNGYVYFGVENLDPETNPVPIFTDPGLTIPLAQPVRTKSGLLVDGDDPVNVYVNGAYSLRVRNSAMVEVLYVPSVTDLAVALSNDLASTASGKGLDLIGRPTVAGLLASTAPARGVDSLWYADDFTYIEALPGATDQHIITAGGVKLYVQPTTRGYDARAFGAKDDWNGTTGTNNFSVFEKMATLKPLTIVLAKSPDGTGVYMQSGATVVTDATGITVDNDPGVSIWVASGEAFTARKGQRSTRDMRIGYNNLRIQQTLSPDMRRRVTELGRPGTSLGAQLQRPVKLSFSDATHWQTTGPWPNVAWTAGTPTSITADIVQWGTPPAAGFYASMFHVVPGDFIQCRMGDLTTYLPAICIFTDDGWLLLRQSQTSFQELLTLTSRIGIAASVEADTSNPAASQTQYRFAKASVGIMIYDQRSFGLVLNGTVIRRYRTSGNIQRAGWAGGFGSAGNFTTQTAVMYKRKKTLGIKPLRVICVGDSTGDETVTGQSQFDFMRQHIGGVGGCQIQTLTNLAHSGDTSANQLTALQAVTLAGAGYDYCLIQIGINDIQGGVPAATFLNNVIDMINYCRASGVEPIVGLPAMFYSQTDAQAFGQDGGATTNSSGGAIYRLALQQTLADNHVYCNLASFEDMGAVLASLLAMKTSPWGDQMLIDNVHPTSWGTALLGIGWAKAIAAHLTHAGEECAPTGTPEAIKLPADYFTGGVGVTSTPQYTVDQAGMFKLGWYLSRDGVALADDTQVGTLPKRLRPASNEFGPLVNTGVAPNLTPIAATSAGFWKIDTDGKIRVYGVAGSPTFLGISASWKI